MFPSGRKPGRKARTHYCSRAVLHRSSGRPGFSGARKHILLRRPSPLPKGRTEQDIAPGKPQNSDCLGNLHRGPCRSRSLEPRHSCRIAH